MRGPLLDQIEKNALFIAERTPEGEAWDYFEDWGEEAIQLAHDVVQLFEDIKSSFKIEGDPMVKVMAPLEPGDIIEDIFGDKFKLEK
jgi:hypothetical protein